MGTPRIDDTRLTAYDLLPNGEAKLKNAVLRLVGGIRGKRKNPIHLLDILAWFRGILSADTRNRMVCAAIHQLENENMIIFAPGWGGYRLKTVGDVIEERNRGKLHHQFQDGVCVRCHAAIQLDMGNKVLNYGPCPGVKKVCAICGKPIDSIGGLCDSEDCQKAALKIIAEDENAQNT